MSFTFTLNGQPVTIGGVAPATTLLDWLRANGHPGSKQGCAEGDCGACTVALVETDAHGRTTYRAINSCIALLPMVAGREIITVEGLASGKSLHPVQSCMVENFGSQCGYCTPGFVMSLFEGCHRRDCRTPAAINDQLCGNLCRCTGYRPIRDAAQEAFAQVDAAQSDVFHERLKEAVPPLPALDYAAQGGRFFRPASLNELLRLKHEYPAARLVAGGTEVGVELNKKFKEFPALISTEGVPDLTAITKSDDGWRIGAAATLTAIEEMLAGEYPPLAKMLRRFGSRQIRNRATLGGNLATASPVGDCAPVLLVLDASVVLVSLQTERTVPLAEFFTGYRQTALRADEVIKEILLPSFPPESGLTRRADFIKVSRRVEMDISIVAAAFCVDVDSHGVVQKARIAYGGVADRPRRALKAEAALAGKVAWASSPAVLRGDTGWLEARATAATAFRGEFTPIDDARGSAAYRRGLVVSLWEKFVSGETSAVQDGTAEYARSGAWPVADATRHLRHESAIGHVTGRAQYVDDTALRRPMLEVWPVMSPHARAKITRRDASAARRAPGVVTVLMAEDIPGENNTGSARPDEPLFAKDEVCFHGQVIGIVVGESLKACREAASLVRVEYEPLPAVLGIAGAVRRQSFHTEPHALRRGDCAAALTAAPLTFAGDFECGGQEHFYLETQAAWAEAGDDDTMVVHSSTQHPSEIQAIVSQVLALPRNKVVVQSPRMGGGFGGKETQGNSFAAMVALAAMKTGRPVRMQLDRDLDMQLTGKRHPFHANFSVGHDAEGRILAARVALTTDGGWSLDLSQPIADRAIFHLDNAYYIAAVDFSSRVARTNVTSQTAFRGFGGPQGMLVMEEILDRIARRTGLPPEVVRERNLYHGSGETNRTHYAEDIGDNRLRTMWQQVMTQSRFVERRAEIAEWNRAHRHVKRGLAVTPVKFGISFTLRHYNQAGALVHLYQDGTIQVNHGGTEMGQGLHTKILGIVMRELDVPAAAVRMMPTSTDKVPNTSATAASSGSDLNGAAVAAACATLRERLAPVRKEGMSFAEACAAACRQRISLSATGYYRTPGIHWDWDRAEGRPFHYFACGAAVSEVEVDGFTGMHRVRRVDIVHDAGDSLNPGVDRGQIEGGFIQGMGWLTGEELRWDAQGRLLTHSASTYQIPAISDAPDVFNVTLLPNATQPDTIHGSKAVGEPPLMLAISVREAIRDAVAAFGGEGEVRLPSPATGEAVFTAIRERQ